jgi:hypothetical protein
LSQNSKVSLEIVNMNGAPVFVKEVGEQAAGSQHLLLNFNNLASGIYSCRLRAGNAIAVRKLIVK